MLGRSLHAPLARGSIIAYILYMSATASAEPPPGYYDPVDASNPTALRSTLHAVIDDHVRFPYTSSSGTDTWDILESADEDPDDPSRILDLYKNASYPKAGSGNADYSREHTWPSSYGFPDDGSGNYPFSDCHALFLSDKSYNSSRGNTLYRTCSDTCTERPTVANHGRGGGSGDYPGNSNWRSGSGRDGIWETWNGRRGDVARALFYLDVRYEGGIHGVTGHTEPDLILTDNLSLIATSGGVNAAVAYMGELSTLLRWHREDPVDEIEESRNDAVAVFQGNRNPFIDNPPWADCVFDDLCTAIGACVPGETTLCLNNGRFEVTAEWETQQGTSGDGHAVPLTPDTGYFWFFNAANVEVVIKVLDACESRQRFWVFAGGLTNVRTVLTVRDTETGSQKVYANPPGTPFQPIQDTNAFATCQTDGGGGGGGDCTPRSQCCRVCTTGRACGDSCIRSDANCHQPRGCACNDWELCP